MAAVSLLFLVKNRRLTPPLFLSIAMHSLLLESLHLWCWLTYGFAVEKMHRMRTSAASWKTNKTQQPSCRRGSKNFR